MKIGGGGQRAAEVARGLQKLEAGDDDAAGAAANVIGELFATHPLMARRVEALRRYAATEEYRRLPALVDSRRARDTRTTPLS